MKYRDLPDLPFDYQAPRPALYCECGEWSAHRGDYFLQLDDEEIVCPTCGDTMELFEREVTLRPWSPPA